MDKMNKTEKRKRIDFGKRSLLKVPPSDFWKAPFFFSSVQDAPEM